MFLSSLTCAFLRGCGRDIKINNTNKMVYKKKEEEKIRDLPCDGRIVVDNLRQQATEVGFSQACRSSHKILEARGPFDGLYSRIVGVYPLAGPVQERIFRHFPRPHIADRTFCVERCKLERRFVQYCNEWRWEGRHDDVKQVHLH